MITTRLRIALYKNALAFLVFISVLCPPSSATSIVAVGTRHGIVIGADAKIMSIDSNGRLVPHPPVRTKVALIHNRIAVANAGLELNNFYSFTSLLEYLESHTSTDETVTGITKTISDRLTQLFDGFDDALKADKTARESIPRDGSYLTIFVAGYENNRPAMYSVILNINWNTLHLEAPASACWCNQRNLNFWFAGGGPHGIHDVLGKTDPPTIQERMVLPKIEPEIEALALDKDIEVGQSLILTRAFLDLEVLSNPNKVAYPLTIFVILPSGDVRKHIYNQAY
jgi:hypothetical protein